MVLCSAPRAVGSHPLALTRPGAPGCRAFTVSRRGVAPRFHRHPRIGSGCRRRLRRGRRFHAAQPRNRIRDTPAFQAFRERGLADEARNKDNRNAFHGAPRSRLGRPAKQESTSMVSNDDARPSIVAKVCISLTNVAVIPIFSANLRAILAQFANCENFVRETGTAAAAAPPNGPARPRARCARRCRLWLSCPQLALRPGPVRA